jgi:hypothetical protein
MVKVLVVHLTWLSINMSVFSTLRWHPSKILISMKTHQSMCSSIAYWNEEYGLVWYIHRWCRYRSYKCISSLQHINIIIDNLQWWCYVIMKEKEGSEETWRKSSPIDPSVLLYSTHGMERMYHGGSQVAARQSTVLMYFQSGAPTRDHGNCEICSISYLISIAILWWVFRAIICGGTCSNEDEHAWLSCFRNSVNLVCTWSLMCYSTYSTAPVTHTLSS